MFIKNSAAIVSSMLKLVETDWSFAALIITQRLCRVLSCHNCEDFKHLQFML